jgi:hypothetical protein
MTHTHVGSLADGQARRARRTCARLLLRKSLHVRLHMARCGIALNYRLDGCCPHEYAPKQMMRIFMWATAAVQRRRRA